MRPPIVTPQRVCAFVVGALLALAVCDVASRPAEAAERSAATGQASGARDTIPRYVVLDESVRELLGREWDAHERDPVELERAYCLSYRRDLWLGSLWVWRVTSATRARTIAATPTSIVYECAVGETTAHVHPDQTCRYDPLSAWSAPECVRGGAEALQCFASPQDELTLARSGRPFALILCARQGYVTYWPPER